MRRLYYSNIYGVHSGGTGGGLSGRGNGRHVGILHHELGHAFGLPHWAGKEQYPYVGPMHGIGYAEGMPHVGPNWGFDLAKRVFISPTLNGSYRNDPLQGGGRNRGGSPHLMTFFSDYSISRIRGLLERTQVIWDERASHYMQWKQETGSYSQRARPRGGPNCPVEDDIDVISVLACASSVAPEANIVYPAIGPYRAGRLEVFDANSPQSRSKARGHGYDASKCNLCLRVTQGEKVTAYLVKNGPEPGDPKDGKTFAVFAINLPARDGEVTQADLLHTPDVMRRGVARDCKVLHSWKAAENPAQKTETVTALYPGRSEPVKVARQTDGRSATKAAKTAPKERPKAIPVKVRKAPKTPDAGLVARHDALLLELVEKALAAGVRPAFYLRSAHGKARLLAIEGADVLVVRTLHPPVQFKTEWKKLALADRRSLALALLREGKPEDHALVAFYS
ncbi:MAG: M66 family metalloprotease, partial [Planctomycetota bacterium]